MKKFTFKTDRPTGKWASFSNPHYIIKLNKIDVGYFQPENPFKINLRILKDDVYNDDNPNCKWMWIRFKKEFSSLQEAKEWLNENREDIFTIYKIVDSE